jgi:LytS/YehU family sensor histidine kinase
VASLIAWQMWRMSPRNDRWLSQPRRWFAATLVWVVPAAFGFVIVVYALRHGVHAAFGHSYQHEPWPQVFRYETIKFSLFYLMFAAIQFGLRSHAAMGHERVKAERLRRLAQQAQLQQLAQQLEPHFLFNALNTIASTIHTDPDLADDLVQRLSSLLRAASDFARRAEVTLAEELQLLEAYAAIMVARFAPRVRLGWDVDPVAQACRVPSLVLQPLLENACRHAMEQAQGPMTITVHSRRVGDMLHLEVRDDQGVPGDPVVFGVGLSNLRQRLQLAYPGQASLTLVALAPRGVSAQIELPCVC